MTGDIGAGGCGYPGIVAGPLVEGLPEEEEEEDEEGRGGCGFGAEEAPGGGRFLDMVTRNVEAVVLGELLCA